jgi:surface antigen
MAFVHEAAAGATLYTSRWQDQKTVYAGSVIVPDNTSVLTQRCREWKHGFRRQENTECVVLHLPNVR